MMKLWPGFDSLWLRRAAVAAVLAGLLVAGGCRRRKYENPITKDTLQPDKVLFDKAINDIERGRYEVARLTLNTLMNTYDTSEFLAKAKLAIADSWFREGGSHGWAQAEAEYKDFILFYPAMEESAEAQQKICDLHYRQMEKPDRDPTHVLRAEEECRQVLVQFPNSSFAPQAAQRLRDIQEVIGEAEYRVGAFYQSKGSFPAAANRLQALSDHYPLFSRADETLWKLGDSYGRLGPRFRENTITAYSRLVKEYPLSPLAEDAKKKLTDMEAEVPEPDPVALARMKYEQENATSRGIWGSFWGVLSKSPDMSQAAKSGQPTMTSLRPSTPVSVPGAAGAAAGVGSDVTISTSPGAATALDTQPDARMSQQPAAAAAAAKPEEPAGNGGARKKGDTKKKDAKQPKQKK
jgi:outer membrane protein assembly factor BamD